MLTHGGSVTARVKRELDAGRARGSGADHAGITRESGAGHAE